MTTPRRRATVAGARAATPLALSIFPFGLVYGVSVAEASITPWIGGLASSLVIAGASQLAVVNLLDEGAPWSVVVGTALVINLRFVMYSAALAPSFAQYPRRWRIPLAMLMTDQLAVTSLLYCETDDDPERRMGHYVGVGTTIVGVWIIATWIGVGLGAGVPDGLQLEFAVPLTFLALLAASLRDRPAVLAAAVSATVTVLARSSPYNSGLLVGAFAGIAAGLGARRLARRSAPSGDGAREGS